VLEQEELERHKLDRQIVAEEHWVRYGVTARRKRNQGRMARLASLRQQRTDQRRPVTSLRMDAAESEGSGSIVFEGKHVAKAYGDNVIVRDLSLRVMRGDRLAIVGANGTGKSTLVKLISAQLEPDSGETRRGTSLRMHVLDQHRQSLPPDTSIKDFLTGGTSETLTVGDSVRHYASYMKDFLFTPEQARTPLRALSGGERGRLVLARALAQPSNLLILDEPTNDLDLETLDLLQETLADYAGTVIVVSHDRDFVDRVSTSVIWAEGDGNFVEYAGGYSDALAQRGEGVRAKKAAEAASPKKAKAPSDTSQVSATVRKKLSFKDKHELETLPARIEKLQAEIQKLRDAMADPGFYERDAKGFATATSRLGTASEELQNCEDRWLELEMLREQLGA
jgi:ATP-binding cassette subfamily F protein uup